MRNRKSRFCIITWLLVIFILVNHFSWIKTGYTQEIDRASTLPDLSGLVWVEDDLFIGIHDAKSNPKKYNWPRVSFVRLPVSELQGVVFRPLGLTFPGLDARSSDMESACSFPDRKSFLFCESGQEGKDDRRIFHAIYKEGIVEIDSYLPWPLEIKNVEATEVCEVAGQLFFLYAERAEDLPSTMLRWAPISEDPLKIGEFNEIEFKGIDPVGKGARPIVAMDIDNDGYIYIVSAFDTGNDNGPFRSVVWRIGKIYTDEDGNVKVLADENKRLATLDGLKVESLAIRYLDDGRKQFFIGTDDEHFGGIIRLLPDIE